MKRDAQATRQRILDAATAEFSRYGLAGARIDRIAAASGSNKAMIYTYFNSKEGLLGAVGASLVAWHLQEVPLDVHDLPEYAGRVFDRYQQHPELLRLVNWDRLEGGDGHTQSPRPSEVAESKIAAIRRAQEAGVLSAHFPAPVLFELLLSLTELRLDAADAQEDRARVVRRQAIKDAVARLIAP